MDCLSRSSPPPQAQWMGVMTWEPATKEIAYRMAILKWHTTAAGEGGNGVERVIALSTGNDVAYRLSAASNSMSSSSSSGSQFAGCCFGRIVKMVQDKLGAKFATLIPYEVLLSPPAASAVASTRVLPLIGNCIDTEALPEHVKALAAAVAVVRVPLQSIIGKVTVLDEDGRGEAVEPFNEWAAGLAAQLFWAGAQQEDEEGSNGEVFFTNVPAASALGKTVNLLVTSGGVVSQQQFSHVVALAGEVEAGVGGAAWDNSKLCQLLKAAIAALSPTAVSQQCGQEVEQGSKQVLSAAPTRIEKPLVKVINSRRGRGRGGAPAAANRKRNAARGPEHEGSDATPAAEEAIKLTATTARSEEEQQGEDANNRDRVTAKEKDHEEEEEEEEPPAKKITKFEPRESPPSKSTAARAPSSSSVADAAAAAVAHFSSAQPAGSQQRELSMSQLQMSTPLPGFGLSPQLSGGAGGKSVGGKSCVRGSPWTQRLFVLEAQVAVMTASLNELLQQRQQDGKRLFSAPSLSSEGSGVKLSALKQAVRAKHNSAGSQQPQEGATAAVAPVE